MTTPWKDCPECAASERRGMLFNDRGTICGEQYGEWIPCPTCAAFRAAVDAASAKAWDEGVGYGRTHDYQIRMCGFQITNPYRKGRTTT